MSDKWRNKGTPCLCGARNTWHSECYLKARIAALEAAVDEVLKACEDDERGGLSIDWQVIIRLRSVRREVGGE